MTVLASAALGLLAGLHAATWGAFKDAPFEGFRLRSYLRSVVLATVIALGVAVWLPPDPAGGAVVLVGVVYAVERLITEWWKAILREDDQDAYAIPMRLGFRGRPVDRADLRYALGAVVLLVVLGALGLLGLVQHTLGSGAAVTTAVVGGMGGWATACGGAWKDAPVEGFSGWKFLRSPAVATAWAVPLSLLTSSWPALVLASGGLAVACIETYKTFLTGGRPPGKFAGRSVRAPLPSLRRTLAGQHALMWVVLGGTFALTILDRVGQATLAAGG